MLDGLFKYEDVVEVPNRCEDFFQDFSRTKGEEMQAYLIRHATTMTHERDRFEPWLLPDRGLGTRSYGRQRTWRRPRTEGEEKGRVRRAKARARVFL